MTEDEARRRYEALGMVTPWYAMPVMKCEHCGKRFATWDGMRRHVVAKHGDTSMLMAEPKPVIRISINTQR